MKNRLILLSTVMLSVLNILADQKGIPLNPPPKDDPNQKVQRIPIKLPIEVTYDTDLRIVNITCISDLEGEVFLYNASNELEDYSPCLNAILTLSESDYHTILIEGDGWSATGVIE